MADSKVPKPPTTKGETAERVFVAENNIRKLMEHSQGQHGRMKALYDGLTHNMALTGLLITTLIRKGVITEADIKETSDEAKRNQALDQAVAKPSVDAAKT